MVREVNWRLWPLLSWWWRATCFLFHDACEIKSMSPGLVYYNYNKCTHTHIYIYILIVYICMQCYIYYICTQNHIHSWIPILFRTSPAFRSSDGRELWFSSWLARLCVVWPKCIYIILSLHNELMQFQSSCLQLWDCSRFSLCTTAGEWWARCWFNHK